MFRLATCGDYNRRHCMIPLPAADTTLHEAGWTHDERARRSPFRAALPRANRAAGRTARHNRTRSEMRTSVWVLAVVALATTTACSSHRRGRVHDRRRDEHPPEESGVRRSVQRQAGPEDSRAVCRQFGLHASEYADHSWKGRARRLLQRSVSSGRANLRLEVGEVSGHGPARLPDRPLRTGRCRRRVASTIAASTFSCCAT